MITPQDAEILRTLPRGFESTAPVIAKNTGISRTTVDRRLQWLKGLGMIADDGAHRGRRYKATDEGIAARVAWLEANAWARS